MSSSLRPSRNQNSQEMGDEVFAAGSAPSLSAVVVGRPVRFRFRDPETGRFLLEVSVDDDGTQCPAPPPGHTVPRRLVVSGDAQMFIGESAPDCSEALRLRFEGEWQVDPKYGLQFSAYLTRPEAAQRADAMLAYLRAIRLPHVGATMAATLVARFGDELKDILSNQTERLQEVKGITAARAQKIHEAWMNQQRWFELVSFFASYGLTERKAMQALRDLGEAQLEARLREDPYLLMDVDGVGFATADRMAMAMGWSHDSPQRLAAILMHILAEAAQREGHTALPTHEWQRRAAPLLRVDAARADAAAEALAASKRVTLFWSGEGAARTLLVGLSRLVGQERFIARTVSSRLLRPAPALARDIEDILEDPSRRLDDSQRRAARCLANAPMAIMTGGPGSGKTTTLRALAAIWEHQHRQVVWAAPTGKAAQRMSEAIGAPASTMHRLLKWSRDDTDVEVTMEGDVFVVDEASMVGVGLLARWLAAIPESASVILVGDADQVLPVDPGNTFRDLIDSGQVPVARLEGQHRTGVDMLLETARGIRQGTPPHLPLEPWSAGAAFIPVATDEALVASVVSMVRSLRQRGIGDEQQVVLTSQNDTPVGVHALNAVLREMWNPEPAVEELPDAWGDTGDLEATVEVPTAGTTLARFRVGDRVLQTKNNRDLGWYNGELGRVLEVTSRQLRVRLDTGQEVDVPAPAARSLQWGYAMTMHKAQGSEWDSVIVVCANRHAFTLRRRLLYTGWTRGRNRAIVVGNPATWHQAIRRQDVEHRHTGLGTAMVEIAARRARAATATPG